MTSAGVLADLGVNVHEVGGEALTGDAVYTFDPMLIADAGAIPLRPGKLNRQGEELPIKRGRTPGASRRPAASSLPAPSTAETPCG